jgi:hypothetical protein
MKKLIALLALIFSFNAFAFNIGFYAQTEFTATTTSTLALPTNYVRKYVLIQNKGSTTVYVSFGAASTSTNGVAVVAGGNYEPLQSTTSSIWLMSASSTDNVVIVEGQ